MNLEIKLNSIQAYIIDTYTNKTLIKGDYHDLKKILKLLPSKIRNISTTGTNKYDIKTITIVEDTARFTIQELRINEQTCLSSFESTFVKLTRNLEEAMNLFKKYNLSFEVL